MKVSMFQLVCCIMVIWSHAGNAEMFLGKLDAAHPLMVLEYDIIPAVIGVCIPCFLMISGYLFFRNFTIDMLKGKWERRIKTLLIPYLIWNLLYYFGYLIMSSVPMLAKFTTKTGLTFSFTGMIKAMIFYTYNPVFWFMFQLILLVILAPVIYLFLKNKWVGAVTLVVIALCVLFGVSIPYLNMDALLYYCTAGYCALHAGKIVEGVWNKKRMLIGVLIFAVGVIVGMPYYTRGIPSVIAFYRLFAVCGLWLMADEAWFNIWRPWMGNTFFIYAFHFIPVRFINKIAAWLFYGSELAAGIFFIIMPLPVIIICCLIMKAMTQRSMAFLNVLNGGRNIDRKEP